MGRFSFWWSYLRGVTPWDTQIVPPEIVALVKQLPPAHALDLGCGTGTNSIYLAQHGWQVTGIDFIAAPVRRAQQKAKAVSVHVDFHVADVTRLDFLSGPYDFAVDIGCLHGLGPEQQALYATNLSRLTRPGAIFALYAFMPCIRNNRKLGLTQDDLVERFSPGFTVESAVAGHDEGKNRASAWYYLRRLAG
jgi:cyclopropane fatty-acyl-phospholipid synthase-like methyltransferase